MTHLSHECDKGRGTTVAICDHVSSRSRLNARRSYILVSVSLLDLLPLKSPILDKLVGCIATIYEYPLGSDCPAKTEALGLSAGDNMGSGTRFAKHRRVRNDSTSALAMVLVCPWYEMFRWLRGVGAFVLTESPWSFLTGRA